MTTCSSRRRRSAGGRLEGARDLLGAIALDDVADLEVVEVLDADAALEPFAHLAHVFLEATERRDRAVVDLHAIADDARTTLAVDDAAAHVAAGDRAEAGDLEDLAHHRLAGDDLALFRTEQALERGADVVYRLVDDAVEPNVHTLAFRSGAGIFVRPYVEPEDDRPGRLREENVAFGDGADAAMDDLDFDFARGELYERVRERFGRAALVRLDQDAEGALLARRRLRHEVLERDSASRRPAALRLTIETLTTLCNVTSGSGIFDNEELIAGHGHALHAEHLHWSRRTSGLNRLAALVKQGADASREETADEVVADLEGAITDQHRRDGTLARIELGLDNGAFGSPIGIRLEVQNLSLEENAVEQLIDVRSLLCRDLGRQHLTAEFLEDDAMLQKLLLDAAGIRLRQIDLVDGDDERHGGVAGVRYRLDGLRHESVVSGDDQYNDIRDLRAASAHRRECLVAGRIKEADPLAVRQGDVVRADVLSDTTSLAGNDVCLTDVVEQRRLSVIDVTHDGHDGRTRDLV